MPGDNHRPTLNTESAILLAASLPSVEEVVERLHLAAPKCGVVVVYSPLDPGGPLRWVAVTRRRGARSPQEEATLLRLVESVRRRTLVPTPPELAGIFGNGRVFVAPLMVERHWMGALIVEGEGLERDDIDAVLRIASELEDELGMVERLSSSRLPVAEPIFMDEHGSEMRIRSATPPPGAPPPSRRLPEKR